MAKKVGRRYPMGVKQRAVERMRLGENVTELARELDVDRTLLYHWKRKLEGGVWGKRVEEGMDLRDYRIRELEAKITGMEGVIGRQTVELDFFAGALRRIKESGRKSGGDGEKASTPRSAAERDRKAD
jgi:transposase-like protein